MNEKKIEQEKEQARSIHDSLRHSLASRALNDIVLSPDLIEQRDQNATMLTSYIVGSNLLGLIRSGGNYFSDNNLDDILDMDDFFDNITEKNYHLIKICQEINDRIDNKKTQVAGCHIDKIKSVKMKLKTDYIMAFKNFIEEIINKNQLNYADLNKILNVSFSDSMRFLYPNENLSDSIFDYNIDQQNVKNLIRGIRHEAAFKEMIYGIDCDSGLLSVVETDDAADARGVDMIVNAKLSKARTADGLFKYASAFEIESGDYQIRSIGIDIKSNPEDSSFEKQRLFASDQEKRKKMNSWKMWSNIYDEDFRLGIRDGSPVLEDYKDGKFPIYLNSEDQFMALERLNRSYITYTNRYGEKINPGSLSDRHQNIMKEILVGINVIPEEATASAEDIT